MSFQSAIQIYQGAGVPGEQYSDGPWRAQSFQLVSVSATNNIIGSTMCTISSEGVAACGNVGGARVIAGLLVDPKTIANFTGSLAATLTVPNYTQVECATMGSYVVTLPGAAAIGDYVIFDNTTGQIDTVTPGTALPMGSSWANAVVDYFTVSGAGLGVITLNPGASITPA